MDEDEEVSGSEDEDDGDAVVQKSVYQKPRSERKIIHSHAYDEFRQFLELGCMGSPVEAYPAVIVVLSTIPPVVSS